MDELLDFYERVWADISRPNADRDALAMSTWHRDLEPMGLDRDIYVSALAFYDEAPEDEFDPETIDSIKEKGGRLQFITADGMVHFMVVCLRFTTTSAMNEAYDYTPIYRVNDEEPYCPDHTVYCIGKESYMECVDEVLREWKALREYTRKDFRLDKWCK